MALTAGDKLGPYEILERIGAGGLGEVYRARDTRLNRDVAIKVLPAFLDNNPDRLARFDREAKILPSLNHPNIAAIYGWSEELQSSNDLFFPLLALPGAQSRRAKVRDIGYSVRSDFESNFGRYLPEFGRAQALGSS